MCAIAGMVGMDTDRITAEKFIATMKRRGPDAQGSYWGKECCLLHTRLAIIDPEGGKQPMALEMDGQRYVIVYNGELYNTGQIRSELEKLGHSFQGHSDTEVVLHAYARWKEGCLEKLNGIFAFAVLEEHDRRLFLARDRIGVKPFFFSRRGRGLIFASEIKTILAYPGFSPVLDEQGAAQLLLLGPGRIPGSGVFRGIEELEPGCYGFFEEGKLVCRKYWYLKDRIHTQSFEETAETVRELVCDAIVRQMVSDVPIGTFLSGGLDSSLISAVCAEQMKADGERLDTFSVDYENNDRYFVPGKFQPESDGEYIHLMKNALDSAHHGCILTPDELMDELEPATDARDLPGMADVDFSLLAFCRRIRKDVKVALSGECADEIFGGYPWYRDPEVRDADGFPWAQNTQHRCSLMHPLLRSRINGESFVREQYLKTCRESDILPENPPHEKRMKEMVNLNFRWFMQTLLDRKDRMSMYCGLEVRVPFCDYRIAEYLYGVPWEYKDYMGVEKGLLRAAMQGILPDRILWRKKSPYPKTHDPRYAMLVFTRLKSLLGKQDAPIWEIVCREEAGNLVSRDQKWPFYGQLMKGPQTGAYLLQLDYWLRHSGVQLAF